LTQLAKSEAHWARVLLKSDWQVRYFSTQVLAQSEEDPLPLALVV
jgi:hypothetical protein